MIRYSCNFWMLPLPLLSPPTTEQMRELGSRLQHHFDSCGIRLHPHPRVTAVAKKAQPPRRLLSPASARRILREYSQTRAAAGISSGEGSEERPSSLSDVTPVRSQIRARSRRDCRGARAAHDDEQRESL